MKYLLTFFLTLCLSFLCFGSPLEQLEGPQLEKLNQGHVVMLQDEREGLPWPKIDAHLKLQVSALDAFAVFAAFDAQEDYVPNLIESKIIKVQDASKVFVQYEMDLPWPIPNNRYVHGHELKKHSEHDYEVSWWMVKSNSAKKVEGSARFYRKKNKTYMHYQSLVVPESSFASLLKSSMLSDVQETLEVIRQKTHHYVKNRPQFIQEYRKLLTQTFQNRPVWKQKIN